MSRVVPNLPALRRLAADAPDLTRSFFSTVASGLRAGGQVEAAAVLARVLESTAGLVDGIDHHRADLSLIFPDGETTKWAELQAKRSARVGWQANGAAKSGAQHLVGTLATSEGVYKTLSMVTPKGDSIALAESVRNSTFVPIPRVWMQGFLGDGPVALQGKPGADGKSFNVEAFALDSDGAFSTFTFGRVKLSGLGSVSIATPRGDVEVTDPALKAKLQQLPKLGVILPGEPNTDGGRPVYDRPVKQMFVLAAFRSEPTPKGPDRVSVLADMATGIYLHKPVELPATFADRLGHAGRIWLRGDFTLSEAGQITGFVADYASKQADGYTTGLSPGVGDADAVQAAVFLAEQTVA